jgi:16S rRNA (cytidine1402-2'-O)-methyltransferase
MISPHPPESTPSHSTKPLGRLILMPNTLDLGYEAQPLELVLPQQVIQQAAQIRYWVVENAKTTRAFLKRVQALAPLCAPLQEMHIQEIPKPVKGQTTLQNHDSTGSAAIRALLQPLQQGHDVGLLSEAGLPAVADPGSTVVALAHQMGASVLPHSGPNSLMLALAASGLHGQCFAFVGYLPQDHVLRATRIKQREQRSRQEKETQILIETPYRNQAVFCALLENLHSATLLSVACGLTLASGWVQTKSIAEWKRTQVHFEKGLPCVFSFLA